MNFFIWLHLEINSSRKSTVDVGSTFAIINFSTRQRLHCFVTNNGWTCENISLIILNLSFYSFRSGIYFAIAYFFHVLFLNDTVQMLFRVFFASLVIRVGIGGSHFAKREGILSFCEALYKRNNKNTKLSISFLAPKFHFVRITFK